jgi:hypothetical protein
MKNHAFTVVFFLLLGTLNAQEAKGIVGESNWFDHWTSFDPKNEIYKEPTQVIDSIITTDVVLRRNFTYLLKGVVYVTNNAVLTIEPGTVIRGDYNTCGTLVVTKGAKLIAKGTEFEPIVFTSNKESYNKRPGDWGGIIILGDAPINKLGGISHLDFNLNRKYNLFGGNNASDNSGVLKYVRIEFAGRKLNSSKELNALSLAGVGSKTEVSYVQVSFSNDDSFEGYGGNLALNNLISYRATDDDFDFTLGAQVDIKNSIAVRYPFSSDISVSRCFEIDSYDKIENFDFNRNLTNVKASNMTLVNNESNKQGLVNEAVFVDENSFFTLNNSVVSGFDSFMKFNKKIIEDKHLDKIKVTNITVHNCENNVVSETGFDAELQLKNWAKTNSSAVNLTNAKGVDIFIDSNVKRNPDFRLKQNNTSSYSISSK